MIGLWLCHFNIMQTFWKSKWKYLLTRSFASRSSFSLYRCRINTIKHCLLPRSIVFFPHFLIINVWLVRIKYFSAYLFSSIIKITKKKKKHFIIIVGHESSFVHLENRRCRQIYRLKGRFVIYFYTTSCASKSPTLLGLLIKNCRSDDNVQKTKCKKHMKYPKRKKNFSVTDMKCDQIHIID